MNEIPNDRLRAVDVPSSGSPWAEVWPFALTFDGYAWSDECGDIANGIQQEYRESGGLREDLTLEELRACLFFNQRSWRHFGEDPDDAGMEYIRALLDAIRSHVADTASE